MPMYHKITFLWFDLFVWILFASFDCDRDPYGDTHQYSVRVWMCAQYQIKLYKQGAAAFKRFKNYQHYKIVRWFDHSIDRWWFTPPQNWIDVYWFFSFFLDSFNTVSFLVTLREMYLFVYLYKVRQIHRKDSPNTSVWLIVIL